MLAFPDQDDIRLNFYFEKMLLLDANDPDDNISKITPNHGKLSYGSFPESHIQCD